jgi:hypothetical protein
VVRAAREQSPPCRGSLAVFNAGPRHVTRAAYNSAQDSFRFRHERALVRKLSDQGFYRVGGSSPALSMAVAPTVPDWATGGLP